MNDRKRHDSLDARWLSAMDACRHDHPEDLEQPELASLAEHLAADATARSNHDRLRKLDARLEQALHDVPLPEGLAERLAAALAEPATSVVTAGTTHVVCDPDLDVDKQCPSRQREAFDRRWVLAALATAASLFLIVWFGWPSSQFTPERVLAAGQQFYLDDAGRDLGRLMTEVSPPRSFPPSSAVLVRPAATRWREIEGLLGRRGVAYDLAGARGTSATLYVVSLQGTPKSPRIVGNLPSAPRQQPASSGGLPAEAWVENGRLYVLVVNGSQHDYREFLRGAGSLT